MEIERKFLITEPPNDAADYPSKEYEQGYLSVNPVVRVRREGDEYFLTYKGGGLMKREEFNLPLTAEAYKSLIAKADGRIIKKTRTFIPEKDGLTIELDTFYGDLAPLMVAEVEFADEDEANSYTPPEWFGRELTYDGAYHNSTLSREGLPPSFVTANASGQHGNSRDSDIAGATGTTESDTAETHLPDTVAYDPDDNSLVIIDQTLLPSEVKLLHLTETEDIREAIYRLQVRGAPAIGVAAAIGLYVAASRLPESDYETFRAAVYEASRIINSARPTAVNLSWALSRMERALERAEGNREPALTALRTEALAICDEDIEVCRKLGEYSVELIADGCGILTHCNAGSLATVRYGTATSGMYLAHERGLSIRVYCDETRPLLQGARLTAFELSRAGIDTTLICDNMSASLMKSGAVDIIFVGADRVAANGDAANKIGTSLLAAAAHSYGVPFYVVAPISTIDINTATGDDIEIEQRDPSEVTELWYEKRMAPEGIGVYNPAFDVTDHKLISGIITEKGILRAPYNESIARVIAD